MMAETFGDGDEVLSWYCTICGRELGADLSDVEGATPCPVHGLEHIAWETWEIECSPTYPHKRLD